MFEDMFEEKLEPWYTIEEIAYVLKLDYETTLKLLENSIPYLQVAGQYRVYDGDFYDFLYDNMVYPGTKDKDVLYRYLDNPLMQNRQEQMVTLQEFADFFDIDDRKALKIVKKCIPHIQAEGHYRMPLKNIVHYVKTL